MSWLISKKPGENAENRKNHNGESNVIVTSHLQLKSDPNNKTGALDKEVVLRRIRQRKRVNKVRSFVGSFFPSARTSSAGEQDHEKDETESYIGSPVQVLSQSTTKFVDNPFVDP